VKNVITDRKVFERYLTDDEVRRLLSTIAATAGELARRDHAWVRLLLATGIRVGTLALLTLDDARIAIETHTLTIRDEAAKGERGYEIHASTKARDALRDLLRVRKQFEAAPNCDALVLARTGYAMSVRNYQQRLREWTAKAGIRGASPHWLRHTLAKRVMKRSEASDPLAIVQVALGHRRRHTTTIYALPDREDIERAMEAAS
jgi:site-specific recombinase XerC